MGQWPCLKRLSSAFQLPESEPRIHGTRSNHTLQLIRPTHKRFKWALARSSCELHEAAQGCKKQTENDNADRPNWR